MRWCFRFPTAPLSVLPDSYLSAEGFVLLLDFELGRLQAQGFPRFHFLNAAIAYAAPAFLQFGWQPPAAALDWITAEYRTHKKGKHVNTSLGAV